MASIDELIEEFPEFNPVAEQFSDNRWTERNIFKKNLSIYRKSSTPEYDTENIREKIAFLIDCYTTFYEKLGNIEEQLDNIKKQNEEIHLLLSKGQNAVMVSATDCFVDLDDEQMKEKILEFYRDHPIVYPSDIAFEFNFDLEKVVEIINNLIEEGKVVETT
jgi:hypothetical protein